MFNAPKQNCMQNLEQFWQSSLLSKIPNALFPPNPSIVLLYIEKSCFYFFTDGKQHKACKIDYPYKSYTVVTQDMLTHDLECPWHDNCIICSYDIMGTDFENSLYAFGQSEKS